MLEPLIKEDLKVIFIGTEPGRESELMGHYYADPRNSFYKDLLISGCTKLQYRPTDDIFLMNQENIGLYDVYNDPETLKRLLNKFKPLAICFNSKAALERFIGYRVVAGNWAGSFAERYINYFQWNPIIWALYDSSGQAAGYRATRQLLLKELLNKLL